VLLLNQLGYDSNKRDSLGIGKVGTIFLFYIAKYELAAHTAS